MLVHKGHTHTEDKAETCKRPHKEKSQIAELNPPAQFNHASSE